MTHSNFEAVPMEILLHESLPTQVACKGAFERVVDPSKSYEKSNFLNFEVTSSGEEIIEPASIYIVVTAKVFKKDGSRNNAKKNDGTHQALGDVIPNSGFLYSLFKNITVKLNNKTIAKGDGGLYPYKADFENRFMSPKRVQDNSLKLSGLKHDIKAYDDGGKTNLDLSKEMDQASAVHACFMERYNLISDSKPYKLVGKLHSEIFDQPKCLPMGSTLDIDLEKNEVNDFILFHIQAADTFKVVIESCNLHVGYRQIDLDIAKDMIMATFENNLYVYPIRDVEMSYFTKSANSNNFSETKLIRKGLIPRRIFIAVIPQESFSGHRAKDPFNYANFGLSRADLKIGGQIRPYQSIKSDFEGDDIEPLTSLLKTTGCMFGVDEIGVNCENYSARNYVLAWDLTSSKMPSGESFELPSDATISLDLRLKETHATTYTMIVYAEYDGEITIDQQGKVKKSGDSMEDVVSV